MSNQLHTSERHPSKFNWTAIKTGGALSGLGLVCVLIGTAGMRSGHIAWRNWRGYTVYASGVSAMGIGLIVLGLITAIVPVRWTDRVLGVEQLKQKTNRH